MQCRPGRMWCVLDSPRCRDAPPRQCVSCVRPRHGGGRQEEHGGEFGARDSKVTSPACGGPLQSWLSPAPPPSPHSSPSLLLSCLAHGLDSPVQTADCRRRGLRELDTSRYALSEHEATHLSRQQSLPALRLLTLSRLPCNLSFAGALVRLEDEYECSD